MRRKHKLKDSVVVVGESTLFLYADRPAFYAMPSPTLYPDSILAMPEKVALIFDDLDGSSTEFFFYVSQQSHKVKRYGERTLGMMDYMGVAA